MTQALYAHMNKKKKKTTKKENPAAFSQAPVVHACNPSHSGGKDQRIVVQSQFGQIVHETLSQKTLSHK
jgi:hypothetical protein